MNSARTRVPEDVSAEVMFQHDRTCCVCRERGLAVQIHHIDENPQNHVINNLAVLCLEHHEQTQVQGGFAKKLRAADVIRFRDDWIRRVRDRRDNADEIIIQYVTGSPVMPVESDEWDASSEARVTGFLDALPSIRRAATVAAQRLWDTGITSEMRQGSYDAIETLEHAWLQLAKFYPPNHFGNRTADHFFSEFIAKRFEWHREVYEPRGPGSSGTIVHVISGGAVLDDVANAIAETVEGLFVGYSLIDFDLKRWRDEWACTGQRDMAEDNSDGAKTIASMDIIVGTGSAFESKQASGLYKTKHTFAVAIKNSDRERFLSNCKLFLDIPDQKDGSPKSYLLVDSFTLNASEERYVPIVSYDEPATVSRHAGDSIHLHIPVGAGYDVGYGWPWQMPVGAYLFTLRVTSKEAAPREAVCKVWVDDEGKLRFGKA
jgi:hypothetical protein